MTPSLRSANLLYLVSALLILFPGSLLQALNLPWGLVGTELLLILLPVLWVLQRRRLPIAQTLRLRWPGWMPVLLAALTGGGTFAVGSLVSGIVTRTLGFSPSAGAAPANPGAAAVLLVGSVVLAPLCEEAFFRGYLFHAYLQKGARYAGIAVALLFAFFHLRFAGLLALLPVALVLSLIRWRTDSLLPGIALHGVHNLLGTGLSILPVFMHKPVQPVALPLLGISLLVGGLAFGLFVWTTRRTESATVAPAASIPASERFWHQAWPLVVFAVLYLMVSGLEVAAGYQLLPTGAARLKLTAPAGWASPQHWHYDVWDPSDRKVGDLECTMTPSPDTIALDCRKTEQAWELKRGSSFWSSAGGTQSIKVVWRRSDMQLLSLQQVDQLATGTQQVEAKARDGGLIVTVQTLQDGTQTLDLPADALVEAEWPWRLIAANFADAGRINARVAWPFRWDPGARKTAPTSEQSVILVKGTGGTMRVLGREYRTVVVGLGSQYEASYAADEPLLLRYTHNMGAYVITSVSGD